MSTYYIYTPARREQCTPDTRAQDVTRWKNSGEAFDSRDAAQRFADAEVGVPYQIRKK